MADKIQTTARRYFYKVIFVSFAPVAVFLFFLFLLYNNLFVIGDSMWTMLEELCGCSNHLSFVNHPYIFSGLIFAGVAGLVWLTQAVFKIIKFRKNTHNFVKLNLQNKKENNSARLSKISANIGLSNKVVELDEDQPTVFCYGVWRPRICISSGMIMRMDGDELRAVLLHEKQHLLSYEPAKLMVLKILEKTFFFFSGFENIVGQYIVLSELSADELATAGYVQRKPLAQALSKMLDWEEHIFMRQYLGISFFSAAIDERINHLSGQEYKLSYKIFHKKFIAGILGLVAIIAILGIFLSFTQTALASHAGLCAMDSGNEIMGDNQCQQSDPMPICHEDYSDLDLVWWK